MEFLKKLNMSGVQFLKFVGFILVGLIVLVVLTNILKGTFGVSLNTQSATENIGKMMPSYDGGDAYGAPELSVRNVVSESYTPPVSEEYTAGDDSEAFEVKDYRVNIETRNLEQDCGFIRDLKSREDVIFENTNEYERGCSYTFKVKKGSVEEVLGKIKDLNPRELAENTFTIKREVDDYTSEVTILENKLATLDSTLKEAISAYENITTLATRMGDVESLAKIIESKLIIIERLTSARIETGNQLERVNRAKADALDRLEYTYFYVNVYENKFADSEEIKNSWKVAVQTFVRETNTLVQELSIGLVSLMLLVLKFALYFFLLLVIAKYGWAFVQKVWKN